MPLARRLLLAVVVLGGLAAAATGSSSGCGGGSSTAVSHAAASGHAGVAFGFGDAGPSAHAGTTAGGVGGSSASPGGPPLAPGGAAGGGAPSPATWSDIATPTLAGCEYQILTAPPQAPLFSWKSCADIVAGCEVTDLNPAVISNSFFAPPSKVFDDGARIVVALELIRPPNYTSVVFFADEDGKIFRGIQQADTDRHCIATRGGVYGGRYASILARISLDNEPAGAKYVVVDGSLDDATPTLQSVPWAWPGGPMVDALGAARWVWIWNTMSGTSLSLTDGETASFALASSSKLWDQVVTTGDRFLPEQWESAPNGDRATIVMTDGVEAPKPYLAAPDGSDYGGTGFANSHVAWRVGKNRTDLDTYGVVELWASPYSSDPAALVPAKVGTLQTHSITILPAAGWGYYAYGGLKQDPFSVEWWNLVSKTSHRVSFPSSNKVLTILGVTRTHLWVGLSDALKNEGTQVARIRLEN